MAQHEVFLLVSDGDVEELGVPANDTLLEQPVGYALIVLGELTSA